MGHLFDPPPAPPGLLYLTLMSAASQLLSLLLVVLSSNLPSLSSLLINGQNNNMERTCMGVRTGVGALVQESHSWSHDLELVP